MEFVLNMDGVMNIENFKNTLIANLSKYYDVKIIENYYQGCKFDGQVEFFHDFQLYDDENVCSWNIIKEVGIQHNKKPIVSIQVNEPITEDYVGVRYL